MKRNDLQFSHFSQAKEFVTNLKGKKVETTGNWSYYQILHHLADGLEFSIYGGETEISIPGVLRFSLGKLLLAKFFLQNSMDSGLPNPIKSNEKILGDTDAEYERLFHLMEMFETVVRFHFEHPIFGELSREDWHRLQCLHFSNHLSYISLIEENTKDP